MKRPKLLEINFYWSKAQTVEAMTWNMMELLKYIHYLESKLDKAKTALLYYAECKEVETVEDTNSGGIDIVRYENSQTAYDCLKEIGG